MKTMSDYQGRKVVIFSNITENFSFKRKKKQFSELYVILYMNVNLHSTHRKKIENYNSWISENN